jgi:hypothetical protein
MQMLRRASWIAVACAAAAAAAPQTDYDPAVDFKSLQRFEFTLPAPAAAPTNPLDSALLHKRVRQIAVDQLTARGMVVDAAAPQVKVRSTLIAKEGAKRKSSLSFGIGGGSYGGGGGVSLGTGTTVGGDLTTEYTLMLEMHDAASGELIWQGWRVVSEKIGDADSSALDKAVREILKPYPPKPKKQKKK